MLNLLKKTPSLPAPIFVTPDFNLKDLESIINHNIPLLKDTTYKCKVTANKLILDYDIKEGKDAIHSNTLQFVINNTIIRTTGTHSVLSLSNYEETNTPFKNNIEKNVIFLAIQDYILNLQNDDLYALYNIEKLSFVQDTNAFTKNYIFHQLLNNESILSLLNISSITFSDTNTYSTKGIWCFVVTTSRVLLINNNDNEMTTIDCSNEALALKEKTGKDLITGSFFSFYTEFMNDAQYVAIFPVVLSKDYRITTFADCILSYYNAKDKVLELASKCYDIAHNTSSEAIHALKSKLITHIPAFQIKKDNIATTVAVLKPLSLNNSSFGNNLIQIATDWNLSYKTQHTLFKTLIELQEETAIKNSIAFYDYFRTLFLEQEKKAELLFEFDLTYGTLLAKAERYKDAIDIYSANYNTLPDDSITDLLPANTANILQGEGGQLLEINLLNSILNWQQKGGLDTTETHLKLAQLQPLVLDRLHALHTNDSIKQKALDIEQVLSLKTITHNATAFNPQNYNRLIKTEVLENVTPECFRDATGFFDTLNSYIASIQSPNYDAVISFSDKLTATNYPEVYKIITNMCYALSIDSPECYIGRANYSNAIIGVEGKPPYLIIGIDFLEAESSKQLNTNELKFLIAIELAHIYFEHTKITSTDVWRGAAEKGFSFLTTVLSIIPFAGSIGNLLGNLSNVDKYAKIIKNVEKATNIAEKGQNILDVSEKLNLNLMGNSTSNDSKSQNLLITSRLMEIIADKVALIFCNDLQAAIKGIILSSKQLEKELDAIRDYGLQSVLERKNDDGSFCYQELIIRIRSLCSFYLSDTFEDLKVKLYQV